MEQRMRIAQHLAGYLAVAVVDDEFPLCEQFLLPPVLW